MLLLRHGERVRDRLARQVVRRAAEPARDEEEVDARRLARGRTPRSCSISSGSAASIRTATPSGASRFASHEPFVFGTSPETSSLPIVRIDAVASNELDDRTRSAEPLEEQAVVRDEQHRAVVAGERALELLDRLDVEMVRRLVEDEAVDAARGEQREHRARALAG